MNWLARGSGSRLSRPARRRAPDIAPALDALEARLALNGAPDDRFENNDFPRDVVNRPAGVVASPNLGPVAGLRFVRNLKLLDRSDFFRIELQGTGTAEHLIRLNFNNANGNLDVQLRTVAGNRLVRQSVGNTNAEIISLSGVAPGSYLIRVLGKAGATNPAYALRLQTPPQPPPPPPPPVDEDVFEGNDSREEVAARPAGVPNSPNLGFVTSTRTLSGLKLGDTYDVFRFELTGAAGSTRNVVLTTGSPLNLVLFNASGQTVDSASAYLGQDRIDLTNLAPGAYFIQVAHYALTPGVYDYSLSINI